MIIKSRLKFILLEKELTFTEVSKRTGIPRVYLSNLAHNKVKDLKLTYLTALCEFLQCKIEDLFVTITDIKEKKILIA